MSISMSCFCLKKAKPKIRQEQHTILASETSFTVNEIEALLDLFKKLSSAIIDDGFIHKEELQLALLRNSKKQNLFVDRVFDMFDIKRNGVIEFGEFVRSLSIFHPSASQEKKIECMILLSVFNREIKRSSTSLLLDSLIFGKPDTLSTTRSVTSFSLQYYCYDAWILTISRGTLIGCLSLFCTHVILNTRTSIHANCSECNNLTPTILLCLIASFLIAILCILYSFLCILFVDNVTLEKLKEMVLATLTESEVIVSDDDVESIVKKTMKEADSNGDGKIDEQEWKEFVAKNPSLLKIMTLPYLKDITLAFPSFVLHTEVED